MDHYDLAVVGGGVGGLTLAHAAARAGRRVVLLEARGRLGGALFTARRADGFWLELGAHTLFNSYGTVLEYLTATGLMNRLLPRGRLPYRLWTDHGIASIPSELRWAAMLRGVVRLPLLHRSERSVSDYFTEVGGPSNYENVIGPALDAVVCQPARDFPADILFQKKPRRAGVPRSFSLPGGISALADALALAPGLTCITGARITAVTRRERGYELRGGGTEWHSDVLGLAVPPDEAARLLTEMHPSVAALLASIETAPVESLGVITRIEDTALEPLAGLIGQRQPFFSVVSRDTLVDATHRGFTFHFRPGVLAENDKIALAKRVIGIQRTGFEEVFFATHTLPSPRLGHAERVARIDESLQGERLLLTGNYFGGLSIEATAARSRAQWQRLQSP